MPAVARRPTQQTKKTSFRLPVDVLEEMRELVEQREAESQTALVELALRRELAARRRQQLRNAYEEAAEDELFMRDMKATTESFDSTVADGLK